MADNFDFTEGAGAVGAADDIGGVYYPLVKLLDGTANSTTPIVVDIGAKANALRVAPANDITDATYIGDIKFGESLPAGTNEIGKLAAGTAAIGKLAANSGVDIGDVDVTSIVPGVGATNLGKAEDAAHASGDVGVAALSVRANAAAALSGADNDYQPLITDANGRLHVIDVSTTAIKTAVEIMDDWDATHASAASADGPQIMGAGYSTALPTDVGADADAVRICTDRHGRIVRGLMPQWFNAVFDSADASAEANVVKAKTASRKIYILSITISVDAEMWVKLQDEDSNALTCKHWFKAGGGKTITYPPEAPLVLNVVNKDLEVITEGAGNIGVEVTGYLAV